MTPEQRIVALEGQVADLDDLLAGLREDVADLADVVHALATIVTRPTHDLSPEIRARLARVRGDAS